MHKRSFKLSVVPAAMCAAFATQALAADLPIAVRPVTSLMNSNGGPNMLGTSVVLIRADRFGPSRVNAIQEATRSPLLQHMIAPARGLLPIDQLNFVQSRVNTSIRWMSDATQWGQHDYWATAEETLVRGAGDMEDRAIVKMHALRALGFPAKDLFVTLARDRVGGPVSVLTVRASGGYYILDDTGGAPYRVDSRVRDFKPILSFGWNGAWVHMNAGQRNAVVARASAGAPASQK